MAGKVGVKRRGFIEGALVSGALPLALGSRQARAQGAADVEALLKAAKSEGPLTVYATITDNLIRRIIDAFSAKYGIKVQYNRFAGTAVQLRYAAEAEAGSFAADILLIAAAQNFAKAGIEKGWIDPISGANLPVITSGQFPAKFNQGNIAVVQVTPWLIVYNKEILKPDQLPKDWPDLLNARFAGQLVLPDPRSSEAYLDFWVALHTRYGNGFFEKIRSLNPRRYSSGVPAIQALAAGEGSLQVPAVPAQITGVRDRGAPLDSLSFPYTAGVEIQAVLTAKSKARSPNAARLFANWLMEPEGNQILNSDPGSVTVYDTQGLPAEYVWSNPATAARKDEMGKLLGFS